MGLNLFSMGTLKGHLKKPGLLNILAVLTGLIAGYGALGFRYLIGSMQNGLFHGQADFHLISPLEHVRGPWVIIIPPIGLLLTAYLVKYLAAEAKGHGVPEVMEAVLTKGGRIRKRLSFVKAIASSLTIASGGSVGREGPIVQIGSSAGSALGQLFNLRNSHIKILVGCGAAGAIAATFNTPIAGVIFAIELIIHELRAKSFIPLVIASVFATVISRYHLGNEPAFIVPEYSFVNPIELIFYLGLGVLAGFVGYLIIKTLYATEDLFDKAPIPFWSKPVIGGLILGITGFYFPQIFGVGYETVTDVLTQNATFKIMFLLIFLKIAMMSITIAAGGSGGVFAPSLFVGAMLGGAYGYVINLYFPEYSAGYGAYALVGMAAVFAATGQAAFTAIVILFEMTLDYSIILPLMFVCVVADQMAMLLCKDNTIYSTKLKRKGLALIQGFGINIFEVTPIKEIMSTELDVIRDTMNLGEAKEFSESLAHNVYPVVNDHNILMGMLRSSDIAKGIKSHGREVSIIEFIVGTPTAVYPTETVLSSFKKLQKSRDPRIVVVDRYSKELLGIVSPTDFARLSSKQETDENE